MSGSFFFVLTSFLFSSIIGYFVVEYLNISSKINYVTLKGPWNINVGFYVMVGFFIFYLIQKIFNGKKDTLFEVIFNLLSIALILFLFSFAVDIPICINLVFSIYCLYFTFFPVLLIYKRTCDAFFLNTKTKNEQSLLVAFLIIALIVLSVDILLFFLRTYS